MLFTSLPPMACSACLFIQYSSTRDWGYQCQHRLGPTTSFFNQKNVPQLSHRPVWWRQLLNRDSLSLDDSSLFSFDIKPAKTPGKASILISQQKVNQHTHIWDTLMSVSTYVYGDMPTVCMTFCTRLPSPPLVIDILLSGRFGFSFGFHVSETTYTFCLSGPGVLWVPSFSCSQLDSILVPGE